MTAINKLHNLWPKWSQTGAIFLHTLIHHVHSNFYLWTKSSCLIKFEERGMPMLMLVKWQSKLLLFWKLFLKIQINSKFDETWSIVFTMKGTSTPFKEYNWATTRISTIKCRKEVNLLLSLQGLRKIYREPKTAADSISLCLT